MTSISTVQLNKMREYEYEKIGPGSYSIGVEKMTTSTNTGHKKLFNKAVNSAFSTTESRNLDTRTEAQKNNPGPGNYLIPRSDFEAGATTNPSSNFLSGSHQRDHNLASDPSYPAPTDYFTEKEAFSAGSLL